MANTKSNTATGAGTSAAKTTKGSPKTASTTKTAKTAPEELEDAALDGDAPYDDGDEFNEYDAAAALEAKAEAAAQEAEAAAQEAEAAAEEAEAAAAAAMAARAALSKRASLASSPSDSQADPRPRKRRRKKNTVGAGGDNDDYLGMMAGMLGNMTAGGWDEETFDDMSQGVAMVLGSGPAFATLGTMLANSTAQSSVLMNATQMQRQLDMVGLSCTSACVQQLLNMNNGTQDPE